MTVLQRLESGCDCDTSAMAHGMLSIDNALSIALAGAHPMVETQNVHLANSMGRVLAKSVLAQTKTPPFDNSGMDGYAVRCADLKGQGPWALPVVDRIPAGDGRLVDLPPHCAMRIFTGAPVPAGADAVIMQERVTAKAGKIGFSHLPVPGENIRLAGEDMALGATVLPIGHTMDVRSVSAAASAGAGQVSVYQKLRVALIITGDETVPAGQALHPGTIWDVNTPMMLAALNAASVNVIAVKHVQDNLADLTDLLQKYSTRADLVITTGGVSVGDEDHARNAVIGAGGKISVSGVAIKPGKPITVGAIGSAVYLGLPGNPVSAFITWTVFGMPILKKMSGASSGTGLRRHVVTDLPLAHKLGRCEFRPAKIVGYNDTGIEVVTALSTVHSARIGPLTEADGLILIPAETQTITKGSLLEFLPFCKT
jgi:molybdopterin molybdotransferase